MDYDNPAVEEQWCGECRDEVQAYLRKQGVTHGQIGEWPAWHVAPHVSVWAIESRVNPGWVGWWAICGDLPTDYISAANIKHPRDVVAAIASRWREAAEHMAQGKSPPEFSVGVPADREALAPLLASRAELLQSWAADPKLWVNL